MGTCRITDCGKPTKAMGLCEMHYWRVRRTGNPDGIRKRPGRPRTDIQIRFWEMVDKNGPIWNGTPCWIWTGNKGGQRGHYIRLTLEGRYGKSLLAHRFSYELAYGPIPEGLTIDHLCRNTRCVNPAHLEPVTAGVNVLRGETITAANAAKTHCLRGHPFDEANTHIYKGGRVCRACKREAMRRYKGVRHPRLP